MMSNKLYLIISMMIVLQGCVAAKKDPVPIPEDFIVRQDSTLLKAQLDKVVEQDYVVRFGRGKSIISEKEKVKLTQWINENKPDMVAIRGTAGTKRYLSLGEKRKDATILLLADIKTGVDVIPLTYDEALAGGRAVITIVSYQLAAQVRNSAPILIIKTN